MKFETQGDTVKGWHSRGYLPHFDSPETVQHVIFRTSDSLPAAPLAGLPEHPQERFRRLDAALDLGHGDGLLGRAGPACLVKAAMLHFDGQRYRLIAWSDMPNHVHALVAQAEGMSLGTIVHSWKSFTARKINEISARQGQFWALDYFDRFIRTETHFHTTVEYIEQDSSRPDLWLRRLIGVSPRLSIARNKGNRRAVIAGVPLALPGAALAPQWR